MKESEPENLKTPSPEMELVLSLIKKQNEKMLDMELVLFLIGHIEKPCEDGQGNNVRSVYLREARTILATREFDNPFAKELLENTVKKYEK